ncbi:MAG: hypothetical protein WAU36_02600 [Cyclobacteriaceae bacterium]
MKKLLFLILSASVLSISTFAQDKGPARPADIGESEFDNFKNSSFNVLEESNKLDANLKHIDSEIKEYSGVMSTVSTDKIKGHYKALTGVKSEVETINSNIAELDNKGKDMVANASKVTPKMKSIKATANTKKAVEGLDVSKNNMKSITQMLQDDLKLLGGELESRGEPIE